MNRQSYCAFFANFANKTRLDIILALKNGPLSVKEIMERVKEEQSTISHNLIKLNSCRVLNVETAGRERIYSLNKETVMPLLKLVEKHVKTHCGRCLRNE